MIERWLAIYGAGRWWVMLGFWPACARNE